MSQITQPRYSCEMTSLRTLRFGFSRQMTVLPTSLAQVLRWGTMALDAAKTADRAGWQRA